MIAAEDRIGSIHSGRLLGAWVNTLIVVAAEDGISYDALCQRIVADALLLAADLHLRRNGQDEAFIRMARNALALLQTGQVEQ